MSNVTVNLDLTYHDSPKNGRTYTLLVESIFNQSNIVALDSEPVIEQINDDTLQITLQVSDENASSEGSSTITHRIPLGNLNSFVDNFGIDVHINNENNQSRGSGHVRRPSAREMSRPLPPTASTPK